MRATWFSLTSTTVLENSEENFILECLRILREVRDVVRVLEAHGTVTESRVPRVLSKLHETLEMFVQDRTRPTRESNKVD